MEQIELIPGKFYIIDLCICGPDAAFAGPYNTSAEAVADHTRLFHGDYGIAMFLPGGYADSETRWHLVSDDPLTECQCDGPPLLCRYCVRVQLLDRR